MSPSLALEQSIVGQSVYPSKPFDVKSDIGYLENTREKITNDYKSLFQESHPNLDSKYLSSTLTLDVKFFIVAK